MKGQQPLVTRIDQASRRRRWRRFAHAGLLALLAAWPLSALALGLGEPVVKSHLGARLQVQIPLILDDGERADEVTVRLASAADRARFGISSGNSTVQMRLAVVMVGQDGPSISVTSAASVREPALTFVIEAKAGSTRFMREYTVLLDPMDYRAALKTAPARSPQTEPAPIPNAVRRPTIALSPAIDGDRYGPVAPGDTLSELGAKLRADSRVSVSQMSMALFQANPQAFTDNDVNRLISGAYLRVPNRDESTAMSSRAAREQLYKPAPVPPSRIAVAIPVAPTAVSVPQLPSPGPSATTNGQTAANESATRKPNASKPASQTPLEPQFRLSILAADTPSNSNVESVISRLSGSKDIAVGDLVTRLETARHEAEELASKNLDLRERIATADAQITKLVAALRERNERIAAVQIAIDAERPSTPRHAAATVIPSVDKPSREQRSEGLLSTAWPRLAQVISQASMQTWLAAIAALCGLWLLVRRSRR